MGQALLCVVHLDQVLVDGARLPQGDVRVGVFNGGNAPIGVDVNEGLLLDVVEAEGLELVVDSELFEDEDGLSKGGAENGAMVSLLTGWFGCASEGLKVKGGLKIMQNANWGY
jgi:hypothetical protein